MDPPAGHPWGGVGRAGRREGLGPVRYSMATPAWPTSRCRAATLQQSAADWRYRANAWPGPRRWLRGRAEACGPTNMTRRMTHGEQNGSVPDKGGGRAGVRKPARPPLTPRRRTPHVRRGTPPGTALPAGSTPCQGALAYRTPEPPAEPDWFLAAGQRGALGIRRHFAQRGGVEPEREGQPPRAVGRRRAAVGRDAPIGDWGQGFLCVYG